ncbi:hypothetical protein Scep_003910 [Stephania cephalantha]|uniref:Uncharacterized protein n=1 Tax=Stephania cephalantha TaxID=152367 RepID=A0AAP0KRI0_9MAGN
MAELRGTRQWLVATGAQMVVRGDTKARAAGAARAREETDARGGAAGADASRASRRDVAAGDDATVRTPSSSGGPRRWRGRGEDDEQRRASIRTPTRGQEDGGSSSARRRRLQATRRPRGRARSSKRQRWRGANGCATQGTTWSNGAVAHCRADRSPKRQQQWTRRRDEAQRRDGCKWILDLRPPLKAMVRFTSNDGLGWTLSESQRRHATPRGAGGGDGARSSQPISSPNEPVELLRRDFQTMQTHILRVMQDHTLTQDQLREVQGQLRHMEQALMDRLGISFAPAPPRDVPTDDSETDDDLDD